MDIIYVGNPYKTDNKTSSHHIAKLLSKDFRVVYLEAGGFRTPRLNYKDLSRIYNKVVGLFKPIKEVEENIFVKSIFSVPFGRFALIRKINLIIQKLAISRVYQRFSLTKPIIWCVSPAMIESLQDFPRSLLVYYCVDDFSAFPDVDVSLLKKLDEQLSQEANLVFTPSMPLYENKLLINRATFLSPHGVDIEHFSKAKIGQLEGQRSSDQYQAKVGFWGLIEHWIDLELVKYCAKRLSNVKFTMIGRICVDLETINLPDNVFFPGPVPYSDLPIQASKFDVMIIPYKRNKQVYNANPLKLREYLATGKPVVSVSSPEINKYSNVVAIADEYEDFYTLLLNEISGNSYSTEADRFQAIRSEGWTSRYTDVIGKVREKLNILNR